MQRSDIEALLSRHHAAFERRDAAALASHHRPDGTFSSPAQGTVTGRAAIERVYKYWFDAFPDMRFTWGPPLIDGDQAALQPRRHVQFRLFQSQNEGLPSSLPGSSDLEQEHEGLERDEASAVPPCRQ